MRFLAKIAAAASALLLGGLIGAAGAGESVAPETPKPPTAEERTARDVLGAGLKAAPAAQDAERTKTLGKEPAEKTPVQQGRTVERHNPFVPSAAMRERARWAGAYGDGGAVLAGDGGIPVLAGIIVRDKAVLACFRSGGATTLVEPGDAFLCGGVRFVFVKYAAEAVTLQDQDGATVEMRLGSREKQ